MTDDTTRDDAHDSKRTDDAQRTANESAEAIPDGGSAADRSNDASDRSNDDATSAGDFDIGRRDLLKTGTALGLLGATGFATNSASAAFSDSEVVDVGAGSYARRKPYPNSFEKDDHQYKYVSPSPVVHGSYLADDAPPTPSSNTWWSHNWFTGSGHQHGGPNPTVPLPWYVDTHVDGLTAIYSDAWLNDPGETQADRGFVKLDFRYSPRIKLMHSSGGFGESKVADWGDFHVTLRWGTAGSGMDVTLVKGSPFIFAEYNSGSPEVRLADLSGGVAKPENVEVWADRGNVLGVTITGIDTNYNYERHYGLFAPGDATWDGKGTGELSSSLGSGDYLTIAPLPSQSTATLDLLEDYAYNHVRDTKVTYDYVPTDASGNVVSEVRSTFEFVTEDMPESAANGSLAGLMPHQWKYTDATLTELEYWSPRGTMKIHEGTSFQTTKTYPGVLPHMPDEGTYDESTLQDYVDMEESTDLWDQGVGSYCSTYWVSKDFDHHLRTIPIAQQIGDTTARDRSLDALTKRLEGWMTVQDTSYGTSEEEEAFAYWDEFGSLIGYPAQFYSSDFVNDHHFHYGYFVKAAAEVARNDGQFVDEYGDMIDLLVREYANWERPTSDAIDVTTPRDSPKDAFPYLRNFDAYEGHSWAAGFPLGDGNDQESSSEAMMANSSMIMWAEHRMATADTDAERAEYKEMRDTAIAMYTEEMHAIWEYWFDRDGDSLPDNWGSNLAENETSGATGAPEGLSYDAYEYASIVWGDGYHRQTFWGQQTMEEIWGINWLPIDGHSFYLNWDENWAEGNWNRMVEARGGTSDWLDGWHTAAIGYRALTDPADAVSIAESELPIGRKSGHIYHWAHNLNAMGTPTQDVVADVPQASVFEDANGNRTYVAYNAEGSTTTVTFSDGYTMDVPSNSLKTSNGDVTEGMDDRGPADTTPPEAPTNLSSPSRGTTSVDLTWDASTSADVASYVVYRDGQLGTEVQAGTTSATITDLAANTSYDFSVSAVDDAGNESTPTGPVTVTTDESSDTTAPAAPSNLTSPAHDDSSVDLDWDAVSASDLDHYTVYVDGATDQTVAAGTTTATVSGLASETTFDFTVTASDDVGNESSASNVVQVTTDSSGDTTAPAAPTNLTATGTTENSIDVSWDASTSSDVAEYTVYLDGSSNQTVAAGTTAASITGLSADTTYDVSVSATDDAGNESPQAGPISPTTDSGGSGGDTVSGDGWTATLTETSSSELEFEFDHDSNSDWVDVHYTINDGGQLNYRMTDQGSFHTHVVSGLADGDTLDYYFTYEEGGLAYDTSSFTYEFGGSSDPGDTTAPSSPTNLSSPDQTTSSIDLDWDAASDTGGSGLDHYVVSVDGIENQTVAAGTTAATVGSLSTGTSYDFSVSAVDGAGNESAPAGPITVSTDSDSTAPTVPSNLASPAHDSSSVDLSWDASSDSGSGVDHYNVYVDGETTPTVQTASTSATVSSLSADTTYDFAVSAVDAQGNESAKTSPISVTTDPSGSGGDTVSGDGWTATLTNVSSSELEFEFDHDNDSNWVDVHYSVNGGTQLNYRMTDQGGYHTHTATGLSSGDTVEYYFTYEEGGLAYDTSTFSYTF